MRIQTSDHGDPVPGVHGLFVDGEEKGNLTVVPLDFEPRLRKDPGLWMWPYKHFRYKPRDADRPYPFYANESGAFEKLRRNSP